MDEALTFDDVLLVPKRSSVVSRKDVDISTSLSRRIMLTIPIVSANMDTVTESSMAITLARVGGIGIIHRFLSIEDQVKEVQRVKRADNIVINEPLTITPEKTVGDVKELLQQYNVSGILVVDAEGKLCGILTRRDLVWEEDMAKQVKDLMTPKEKLITAPRTITHDEAKKNTCKISLGETAASG